MPKARTCCWIIGSKLLGDYKVVYARGEAADKLVGQGIAHAYLKEGGIGQRLSGVAVYRAGADDAGFPSGKRCG